VKIAIEGTVWVRLANGILLSLIPTDIKKK